MTPAAAGAAATATAAVSNARATAATAAVSNAGAAAATAMSDASVRPPAAPARSLRGVMPLPAA